MTWLSYWDSAGARFATPGMPEVSLSVADLIECAPAQFDAASGQRSAPLTSLPATLRLLDVETLARGWAFHIETIGAVTLAASDLAYYLDPVPAAPAPQLWLKGADAGFQPCDYNVYMADEAARRQCLEKVASQGWAALCAVPSNPLAVETVIRSFGFVRETNYGRTFDVRSVSAASNLAFTNAGLAPHTDNPYRDPVPGLQLLHCLVDARGGGETRLVDGFAAAEALRTLDPEAFGLLIAVPVRFAWCDGTTNLESISPVLTLAACGAVIAVRYNHRAFKAITAAPDQRTRWRAAYRAFAAIINAPEHEVIFKMRPGDLVIMDNYRILHARLPFADGPDSARHLVGAYADRDGLLSTLTVLTDQETDRRLHRLDMLFGSTAMDERYGELLSLREHMLQTAYLADQAGLAQNLVAAALLHDIGWALNSGERAHDQCGANLLADMFGYAVSEPVRNHVEAKRYLVACEPNYAASLSLASLETLRLQGGAMTETEAAAFELMAGFADAITLRRCDDAAKHPFRKAPDFAPYRPMLRRLIRVSLMH